MGLKKEAKGNPISFDKAVVATTMMYNYLNKKVGPKTKTRASSMGNRSEPTSKTRG